MPVPVDYSSQLEDIAKALKALNHDSTPSWLIALFSALLGFLASVILHVFQHWYGVARSYQSGSRNPRSPDPLAFWRRYSA